MPRSEIRLYCSGSSLSPLRRAPLFDAPLTMHSLNFLRSRRAGSMRSSGVLCAPCVAGTRSRSAASEVFEHASASHASGEIRRPSRQSDAMCVRIPPKAISHSGRKPITVPGGNRSGVGAKRRWHFDVAKTDRNRQVESVRSEAKEGWSWRGWGCGARGRSPLPRLSTH
jgi:hypothetical protein